MLVLSRRLLGTPIMSLQTGSQIGKTDEPIIDPRRLHIVAFYCVCGGLKLDGGQPAILHTSDIRELSDLGIIINSSDDIMAPKELVRLSEVIEFNFKLRGIAVVTEHGEKLGTVEDYTTDSLTFLIHKLHVKRPLLKSFNTSDLIIDREQILEVSNQRILVRSATIKSDAKAAAQPLSAFVNPFRKPQAEVETTNSIDQT